MPDVSLHAEVGALLAAARSTAGLTQAQIAKKLRINQSRVSRIESGEGATSPEDYIAFLDALDTEEAARLKRALAVTWKHLPPPSLRHPDLSTLIDIESALERLDRFKSGENVPRVLAGQAELLFSRLRGFGDFLQNLNHSVAYIGDIGVGKTTAACRQSGMVVSPATATDLKGVILDTGGGRVTLCEVSVVHGARFAIDVEPLADEEVYRLVGEFCRSLVVDGANASASQVDFKLPEETERALRNMSGLARMRRKVDGKSVSEDRAADLAKTISSADELHAEIAARLTLWRRTRRTIEFEGADEAKGRQWQKETFASINNGRHSEFSLPGRIIVTVPFSLFLESHFGVTLVDTRGVDGSAIRPDIVAQLKTRRTVTVLCSRFNSAPDVSLHGLLKHIRETDVDPTLNNRIMLLVLARPGEALAMRDDTGQAAEDAAEGYAIKRHHVEDALAKLGLLGVEIQFFDSSADDAGELSRLVTRKIESLRQSQSEGAISTVGAVDQMLANVRKAQALAALEEINRELSVFAGRHRRLKERKRPSYERLLAEISQRHPRTVWAATRRSGEFWNFDVYQHLGDGAAAESMRRCTAALQGLREIVKNKLGDASLKPTHGFLEQLLANIDLWEEDFVGAARHHAVEIYRPRLSCAQALWEDCEQKYGCGLDYRDEVAAVVRHWFDGSAELEEGFERMLQKAWRTTFLQPLQKAAGEAQADESQAA